MIPLAELRHFLTQCGAEIVHEGSNCATLIKGFAHYEDAGPGTMTWHRHVQLRPYAGTVLFCSRPYAHPNVPTQMIVAHPSTRSLVGLTIREFNLEGIEPPHIHSAARVHPWAIIGIDGQNYEWTDRWLPFPSSGGVHIDDDVEVGPYATIVRGSVGNTHIGRGCRIGQHVNIGHDCRIGRHTLVVAHSSLAGWVRVGERCKIYQGARIKNGVRIGDGAVIGMGAVVLNDVGPGEIWAGNPAQHIEQ